MSESPLQTALLELEELLDIERSTIMRGATDDLQTLAERKEHLLQFASTAKGRADHQTLAAVQKKASRNRQLLASAMWGVKSAIERLEAIRTGQVSTHTYTDDGSRQSLQSPGKTVEHKV